MSAQKRIRVLWLCSWYPSEVDAFAGDFIQRHAEAASIFSDICVIHCVGGENISKGKVVRLRRVEGLLELICYYSKKGLFGRILSPIRWGAGVKKLIFEFIRSEGIPDIIHVQIPFKSGIAARCLRWKFGVPYVVTEHWGGYNEIVQDRFSSRPFWFKWLTRFAYNKALLSLSVSEFQAKCLDRVLTPINSVIIRNVVNTDIFNYYNSSSKQFTFIHVSDWSKNKNPEGIIRAFLRFYMINEQIKLVLVGGIGANARRVKDYLNNSNANIELYGELTYFEVAKRMKESNCLIMFSEMESASCVIAEAHCVGLQVISSCVGGAPEIVDQLYSQLVDSGDEDQLFVAMRRAYDMRLNFNAKTISDRAKRLYSYEVVGAQIEQAYKLALSG